VNPLLFHHSCETSNQALIGFSSLLRRPRPTGGIARYRPCCRSFPGSLPIFFHKFTVSLTYVKYYQSVTVRRSRLKFAGPKGLWGAISPPGTRFPRFLAVIGISAAGTRCAHTCEARARNHQMRFALDGIAPWAQPAKISNRSEQSAKKPIRLSGRLRKSCRVKLLGQGSERNRRHLLVESTRRTLRL